MYLPNYLKHKTNQELFNLLLKNKNQLDKKTIKYIKEEIISRGLSFDEIRRLSGVQEQSSSNKGNPRERKSYILLPLQLILSYIAFINAIEVVFGTDDINNISYTVILVFILAVVGLVGIIRKNKSGWYASLTLLFTYIVEYLIFVATTIFKSTSSSESNLIIYLLSVVIIAFNSFYIYIMNSDSMLLRFRTERKDLLRVILFSALLILFRYWT